MSDAKATPKTAKPATTNKADKPSKVLPTNRVSRLKTFDIVRAFGATGDSGRPVSNVEVSKLVNLHSATVGLTLPFLTDIGLLRRTPDGMIPLAEVISYAQAFRWNPDTAAQRLAPVFARTW